MDDDERATRHGRAPADDPYAPEDDDRAHQDRTHAPMDDPSEPMDAELATQQARTAGFGLVRRMFAALVGAEDVRGTTYLLLDGSASMGDPGKLPQLRRGALRFFAEAWTLGYRVGAIRFSRRATVVQAATRDFVRFQRSLDEVGADGRTAMSHAIRLGTRKLRRAQGDRVLLLITDGMPDRPDAALAAAREARAAGITLIAVGTDGADEAFLASLTGHPELAHRVERDGFEDGVGGAAGQLPRPVSP